jgi:hypothetical protein
MRPNLASVELAYRDIADHPFRDAPSKKVSASFFKGNCDEIRSEQVRAGSSMTAHPHGTRRSRGGTFASTDSNAVPD